MPLKLIPPAKAPGGRCYYVRGSYLRVRVYRSTGTDKPALAKAELKRLELEIERGRYAEPTAAPPASFADAALGYLKDCGASEVPYVERLLKHFQTKSLTEFNKDVIDAAELVFYPGGLSKFKPGTLNRMYRAPLAAVLHHAAKRGIMPWIVVEKHAEAQNTRWLEPDQATALIAAAAELDSEKRKKIQGRLAPLLVFLFTTGARISEACNLTWADVDLKRSHAILRNTKNGETYGVHLGKIAALALANIPGGRHPEARCFGYRNRHSVKYSLGKACEAAGLVERDAKGEVVRKTFTLHQARHSFATWLRRNGEDIKKMMELGRWKDLKSVMRYAHVSSSEHAPAIAALPINADVKNA